MCGHGQDGHGTTVARASRPWIQSRAAILLMVPPANHRLARREEHTEAFYRFASWIIVGAVALVGLGIATDFFILMEKVVHSIAFSLGVALALLIFSYALWFAWAICRGAANHTS